jgi:hypothetical protein
MTSRVNLYRRGQRVSVFDPAHKRWCEGRVVKAGIGRCTVATREPGAPFDTWHIVPTTPAWVRPVYVIHGCAA